MLARIRKSIKEKDQGFTLIELLVVMIIIGILAAIAIPVFLSQRKKAQDSAVKSDVSALGKEMTAYFVDAGTTVPAITISGSGTSSRYNIGPAGGAAGTTTDVGKVSNGVIMVAAGPASSTVAITSLTNASWTASNWCVTLYNPNGSTKAYKFSALNGLESGWCTSDVAP